MNAEKISEAVKLAHDAALLAPVDSYKSVFDSVLNAALIEESPFQKAERVSQFLTAAGGAMGLLQLKQNDAAMFQKLCEQFGIEF